MYVKNTASLLISCPKSHSRASVRIADFLQEQDTEIASIEQQNPPEEDALFLRLEIVLSEQNLTLDQLYAKFEEEVAKPLELSFKFHSNDKPKKIAIMVSKHDHVLLDLLWRHSNNTLGADIAMVLSNHPDLREEVEQYGIPFHEVPITSATKDAAENKAFELMGDELDLIILARYMQILSEEFTRRYATRVINIHHSFLPAFIGANPYKQAFERGVKLIGATAHYATGQLDQGPIVEQDSIRVSHRYSTKDLKEIGRDLERNVLSRAVKWHIEDRIIIHNNKTFIFYN